MKEINRKVIDYKKLQSIMKELEECVQETQSECEKENPDIVILCNCIESVGNLLDDAERCINPFN